jgi:hypothetical protein
MQNVYTGRRLLFRNLSTAADEFERLNVGPRDKVRDADAEIFIDCHDLAARPETVVQQQIDGAPGGPSGS